MKKYILSNQSTFIAVIFPLVSSIVATFFLFYIDEGLYNFAWIKEAGAWIVFSIYVLIFFTLQVGIGAFAFKNQFSFLKGFLIALLSILLGLLLFFIFVRII